MMSLTSFPAPKWQHRWISWCIMALLGFSISLFGIVPPAFADIPTMASLGDPAISLLPLQGTPAAAITQPPIEVKVSLGTSANELKFVPNQLEFIAGNRYNLVLTNPSPQKHYFSSKDFADASWIQAVETDKIEVKGAIHEVELQPGGELEWIFVPMKPGKYELHCSILGHTEAGMTGEISIVTQ